jgi:uncharacterized protein (DUF2267 family)
MTSPRSVEIKLGAEKPLKAEEAKRYELKLPMEIKPAFVAEGESRPGQPHLATTRQGREGLYSRS